MRKATNLHADPHLLRQTVPKVNALTRCAPAARRRPLHYAKTMFQLPGREAVSSVLHTPSIIYLTLKDTVQQQQPGVSRALSYILS